MIMDERAVATEIEVRYPSDKKTADDEIARRVPDILAWDATVPRNAIKITVHDGRVTLSGEVNWQFELRAAEDQVRKLTGVNAIINNIRIRSSVYTGDVKVRIENALKRSAEIEANAIEVRVDGGTVALDGVVHNWREREAAERAAWSAFRSDRGAESVENPLGIRVSRRSSLIGALEIFRPTHNQATGAIVFGNSK